MADSPDLFESNTVSSSLPDSWEQDSDTETIFAWLRPMNEFARHAFHLLVDRMIQNPDLQISERRFVHLEGRETIDTSSLSSSDDEAEQGVTDKPRWVGAFKFSTAVYPKDPTKGWFIGTGRGSLDVDVVIGPPDLEWKNNKIRGNHARLYIHKESCRPTVEALHCMAVSGATGVKHIAQGTTSSSKVLEHGHQLEIGRCTYLFLHGNAMKNGEFNDGLRKFMKTHHGKGWRAHPILSATSKGSYLIMDQYTFLPGAFAAGTFGEVTAGWAQNGSAVAVKRFKSPDSSRFNQHQKIMGLIGTHPNILELLYSSSNPEPAYPAIYCVYSPLAFGNLQDVIAACSPNLSTQIGLLIEYLQGLTYLHDQKGIMHRDIKPKNLAVMCLSPPRGIILDLDNATSEETSYDYQQGTVSYQAPEIINLSFPAAGIRQSYGRSADVWALGMSAFCALRGAHTNWNIFDRGSTRGNFLPGTTHMDFVTETRLETFHEHMGTIAVKHPKYLRYIDFLIEMTAYRPVSRFTASKALNTAEGLWPESERGKPVISSKAQARGIKRKIGKVE